MSAGGEVSPSTPPEVSGIELIEKISVDVQLAAYDAQNLGTLLDDVHSAGFEEASATQDWWRKRWWEQVGYIARTLGRLREELQANNERIEQILHDIKSGRRPL